MTLIKIYAKYHHSVLNDPEGSNKILAQFLFYQGCATPSSR